MSSSAPPVVEVSHLSKRYTRDLKRSLRYGVANIAREFKRTPRPLGELRRDEFLSLDDVSVVVQPGEALAVLGANGAGKSTMLKILHGLLKPDEGEVRIRGRVGALIELGAGFDPILTGRENIATQGLVLGFSSREIAEFTDRVIDFAELEHAIDTPVRYYSSGMNARLAFSVAAQMRADLILVDEVLAVGDLAFQRKCIAHLLAFIEGGGTVILVSHSVHQMQAICTRGLLLQHGRNTYEGDLTTAIGLHLESQRRVYSEHADAPDHSDDPVQLLDVAMFAAGGGEPRHGEPAEAVIRYSASERFEVLASCSVWTPDSFVCITGTNSSPMVIGPGPGVLRASIERLPLMAGGFTLRAAIVDAQTLVPLGMVGFGDAPMTLTVGVEPHRNANAMEAVQQLSTFDATWDAELASSEPLGAGDPTRLRGQQ